MHPDRIAELLQPFLDPDVEISGGAALLPSQLRYISTYIDLLTRWNSRINLTSVRQPEEIVTRHFGESLFAARHLFPARERPQPEAHVIDVGSGAGFPGLPIKIWAPPLRLTLIESNHKKVAFLRQIVRTLTLANVNVFAGRAEDYPSQAVKGDLVTLRAVERFESILSTSGRLLNPAGRLAILIGQPQISIAKATLPLHWQAPVRIPLSSRRFMVIGS
jgi:16S rRNA (guanine527-N7)-methyltransferase